MSLYDLFTISPIFPAMVCENYLRDTLLYIVYFTHVGDNQFHSVDVISKRN